MGYIKDLVDKTIDQIINIIDAGYEGDPNGTDAGKNYFITNIGPYLKDLGVHNVPSRTYIVCEKYTTLGTPFFPKVYSAVPLESCYGQIALDGSGTNNKAFMLVRNKPDSYADNCNFNHNGYVMITGESKFGAVISGTVTISAGIHVFTGVKFDNNITVSGGTVFFYNCLQTNGTFNITGTASVVLAACDVWGAISVTDLLDGVGLWLEDTKDIRLPGSGLNSINIPAGLTNFVGVIRNVRARGVLNDTGNKVSELVLFKPNAIPRPVV